MSTLTLYYATNRNHIGADRWKPTAYGDKFSADGMGNLRFGALTIESDDAKVNRFLNQDLGSTGVGNGEDLAGYYAKCAQTAVIEAYEDPVTGDKNSKTPPSQMGSKGMFSDLQSIMKQKSDVLIYIHGFNVNWYSAVGTALALQTMLQQRPERDPLQDLVVVLFTWPSDGKALPWVSYKSDRREATGSGEAVARAIMKVQDYLMRLRGNKLCAQDIHLLCHSMGNFLLQAALGWIIGNALGVTLPRLFEHIFLCAPDVDDDALEPLHPLGRLQEMARTVSLYHNKNDLALHISDYTKGNPERLGGTGAARPAMLHQKIQQIDCEPIVHGIVEHSYYLCGRVCADIRMSIDGRAVDDPARARERVANYNNVWAMKRLS